MAFKVGQIVICINGSDEWESYADGSISDGPKKGEILVIDFIECYIGEFF
jgi:hypothetical protein